jgi:hypothetical protein
MPTEQLIFTIEHQGRGLPHVHIIVFDDIITVCLLRNDIY